MKIVFGLWKKCAGNIGYAKPAFSSFLDGGQDEPANAWRKTRARSAAKLINANCHEAARMMFEGSQVREGKRPQTKTIWLGFFKISRNSVEHKTLAFLRWFAEFRQS